MGCGTFTPAEEATVMSLWSMWSAPLLMSNDIANVPPSSKALLQNKELLAINQDPLGRMGRRFSVTLGASVGTRGTGQGWRKDLANGDVAVVLFNPSETATKLSFELSDVGFAPYSHVHVTDVLGGSDGSAAGKWVRAEYETETAVAPHGAATLRLAFTPGYPEL